MKEVNNISYKGLLEANQYSLGHNDDRLNSIQEEKRNNSTKTINKNPNKQDFDVQNKSLFEIFLTTIPDADNHIHEDEERLIDNDLIYNSYKGAMYPSASQYFTVRDLSASEKDFPSIESFASKSPQDIEDISGFLSPDFSILLKNKTDRDYSDGLCTITDVFSQLKSDSGSFSNYLRHRKEMFSEDVPLNPVDFLLEKQLDTASLGEEICNLKGFSVPSRYQSSDSLDALMSTESVLNQKSFMRVTMIPESVHYTDTGSIKALTIQMKPNSPDNIVATLCLSGEKLSVKLRVESDFLYKKIQSGRQNILDALNFSGYTMDRFDVEFVRKDSLDLLKDSMNYCAQQQGFTHSNEFEKKKLYFPERERTEKKFFWGEKRSGPIYNKGEIIGIYSNYIYV
ncbi:hypothetical protein Q7L87_03345 [Candidatus Liberibacter asiaticus]